MVFQFFPGHLSLGGIEMSNQSHCVFIGPCIINNVFDSRAVRPRGLLFQFHFQPLFPWPRHLSFHVQHNSLSMSNTTLVSWPTQLSCHGQHNSLAMANAPLFPWPTQLSFHGQHNSLSMANAPLFPWPMHLSFHGQCTS